MWNAHTEDSERIEEHSPVETFDLTLSLHILYTSVLTGNFIWLIRKLLKLVTNNLFGNKENTYQKTYQRAYDKLYGDWIKKRRLRKGRSSV
jgi:hypothetical protein